MYEFISTLQRYGKFFIYATVFSNFSDYVLDLPHICCFSFLHKRIGPAGAEQAGPDATPTGEAREKRSSTFYEAKYNYELRPKSLTRLRRRVSSLFMSVFTEVMAAGIIVPNRRRCVSLIWKPSAAHSTANQATFSNMSRRTNRKRLRGYVLTGLLLFGGTAPCVVSVYRVRVSRQCIASVYRISVPCPCQHSRLQIRQFYSTAVRF